MLANLISDRSIHLLWSLITRDGHAPLFPMRISAYWRIYAIIPHICPNIFCGAFSRTRMAIPNNHSYNLSCHRTLTRWTLRTTPAALCGISQRPGCSGKIWIQPSCQTVDTLWHMMKMQFHTSKNCDKIHPVRKETMYDCCVNPFVDITYTIRCQPHIFWFSAYCPDMIFVKSLQQLIFHNHTIWCQHIHFGPFFYQVVMNVDWFVYSGSIRKERCLLCSKPRDGDCEVI